MDKIDKTKSICPFSPIGLDGKKIPTECMGIVECFNQRTDFLKKIKGGNMPDNFIEDVKMGIECAITGAFNFSENVDKISGIKEEIFKLNKTLEETKNKSIENVLNQNIKRTAISNQLGNLDIENLGELIFLIDEPFMNIDDIKNNYSIPYFGTHVKGFGKNKMSNIQSYFKSLENFSEIFEYVSKRKKIKNEIMELEEKIKEIES